MVRTSLTRKSQICGSDQYTVKVKPSSSLSGPTLSGHYQWCNNDLFQEVAVIIFVILVTSYFLLSSPLFNGHSVNMYHTSAIYTLDVTLVVFISCLLAQEQVATI